MLDALKTLFENDVVSAEVRQEIEEAWEAKIKENKLAVTAELREEFAQIRQRFAKLRLKIPIDSLTDSADNSVTNSATSTPIKKVISALDSPH